MIALIDDCMKKCKTITIVLNKPNSTPISGKVDSFDGVGILLINGDGRPVGIPYSAVSSISA